MAAFLEEVKSGRTWRLRRGLDNVIGRSVSASVHIAAAALSRQHARLREDASGWSIEDLGSGGGTWWCRGARWERITQPRALKSGDLLRMGEVELRFVDDGLTAGDEDSAEAIVAQLRRTLFAGVDPYAAQCLVAHLDQSGGDTGPALEAAREAMRSPSSEVRLVAAFVLGPLCRSARPRSRPVDELASLTRDVDRSVRQEAVAQLGAAIGAPIAPLLEALEDPDDGVFRSAVRALTLRGDSAADELDRISSRAPPERRSELEQLAALHRKRTG